MAVIGCDGLQNQGWQQPDNTTKGGGHAGEQSEREREKEKEEWCQEGP